MRDDPRFVVRGFHDSDDEAILEMFARAFPFAPRTRRHFDWKYRRSPFGNGRISLTFDAERRLVGHYAGYPVPFRVGGKSVVAHQVGDTMTDPVVRHVGRGPTSILGRTALDFYERFCAGRVAFNFGFNVANIQKFSLRFLRSTRVEPVTYRVLEPRPRHASRGSRWLRGLTLERVAHADGAFDDFFARAAAGYDMLVQRGAAWVQWRYLECPDREYVVVAARKWGRLAGWLVYRLDGARMIIGDALVHREIPEALDVILAHVVPLHRPEKVDGWFSPRPAWLSRHLASLGFVERPEPQDLSLMCVPFGMAEAPERMRESLYYTWGDSDLF